MIIPLTSVWATVLTSLWFDRQATPVTNYIMRFVLLQKDVYVRILTV